jgi:hypothetical protein
MFDVPGVVDVVTKGLLELNNGYKYNVLKAGELLLGP